MGSYIEQLFSLKGKIALVAGGLNKIDAAIVEGLAQSGAIACGTKNTSLQDLSRFSYLCDRLCDYYGRLNILVNVTEISVPSTTIDSETGKASNFHTAIEKKLLNVSSLSKIAAKTMQKSGGGSIINAIVIKDAIGFPDDFSYAMTKNTLLMVIKELAIELFKQNVRINNIVMGYVPTNLSGDLDVDLALNYDYKDLLGATIFLASNNSASITGQDIFIIGEPSLKQKPNLVSTYGDLSNATNDGAEAVKTSS